VTKGGKGYLGKRQHQHRTKQETEKKDSVVANKQPVEHPQHQHQDFLLSTVIKKSWTADKHDVYPRAGSLICCRFLPHPANPYGIDARCPHDSSCLLRRRGFASPGSDTSAVQRGAIDHGRHDWHGRSFRTRPAGWKGKSTPSRSPGRELRKRRGCSHGCEIGDELQSDCWAWCLSGLCVEESAGLSSSSQSRDVRGRSVLLSVKS
jgi:hypothetical protein